MRQALTGERAGQVLSSEITSPARPPRQTVGKATQYRALVSKSCTGPVESETLGMRGDSMHENREISAAPTMGGWVNSTTPFYAFWPKTVLGNPV